MSNLKVIQRRFFHGFGVLALTFAIASCGGGGSSGGSGNSNPYAPAGGQQPGSIPPNATVVNIPMNAMGMGPAAYGVNPLVVKVGTTVTWVNKDTMSHTSTSDTGVWDSGVLASGLSFSFQFSSAGTFPYHCTIHGAASMSGTVQVNP